MLLGGSGTFDLVKQESALNKGLRSPQKQMCCPTRYGQNTSAQSSRSCCPGKKSELISAGNTSFLASGEQFPRSCGRAEYCFAAGVKVLRSCRVTEELSIYYNHPSTENPHFISNSSAAHPFKQMKGATKFALAWREYSIASSSEKLGRERYSCLPFPKRSKFFCSDMSRPILTVAGY